MASTRPRTRSQTNGNVGISFPRLEARSSASKENGLMPSVMVAFKGSVSALCGLVFGIAVEKSRVFEPAVVTNQMLFRKFIMMKVFLTSLTVGMFFLSVLSILPLTRKKYLLSRAAFIGGLNQKGYFGISVGGFILGSGMAVVGTCPGLVGIQMGGGVHNSVFALAGVLTGTVLYGVTEPIVTSLTDPTTPIKYHFLYQLMGSPPFIISFPVFSMLGIVVFSLEMMYPWQYEVAVQASDMVGKPMLAMPCWHPYICGTLIGCLQVPLVLFLNTTLGGSRCYCTVVSQGIVNNSMKKLSPYLAKFKKGFANWWQVIFIGGSALGSYISATASGQYGNVDGVSPGVAFLGGVMIIFGARMAGGCTSGHGLSGVGLLNLASMAAVMCMFSGGIVTANLLELMS
ncbi:LOW QUALITY PROTEIN: UPF0394 inner membrane protein YeeE-like [Pecten maximus]|uniref:LOW QUALITY PROTEIN: UPF0394 inner membrane protein YeeE-like n=1 Tax=Pecten maximus TaxID=6579 RepID=UPI0014580B59|nr:LOW QUALITY PROTEIN: UPF0394 inner membrane protein YeeE-like [Pecten maximus]